MEKTNLSIHAIALGAMFDRVSRDTLKKYLNLSEDEFCELYELSRVTVAGTLRAIQVKEDDVLAPKKGLAEYGNAQKEFNTMLRQYFLGE